MAALLLRVKGYRIEERNWRCGAGELDIVARDGATVVFVEVKARANRSAGSPEEAVDARKQRRLVLLAQTYLASRRLDDVPCRFDVITVERNGVRPIVRHIKDAFRADGLV